MNTDFNELPLMATSSYASASMGLGEARSLGSWINSHPYGQSVDKKVDYSEIAKIALAKQKPALIPTFVSPKQPEESKMPKRRIVQVFIADTDENVPLDQCLLYKGDQKLTDATDQELFFEIDIKSVIDKHNKSRAEMVNKIIKERVEYLEPVKIRDLKMTVVTIAEFT